jgi:hypothetical protein
MSKRRTERKKLLAKKKAAKKSGQANPGGASVYALKRKGQYPQNSPYRTVWAEHA